MPTKLLVLGIDAASPTLLRTWADSGKLPAIRGLMDRGTAGSVRGVKGFFVGSTWPSFYTGLNPAGHGFYRINQLRPGTYEIYRPLDEPGGVGGTSFWRLASDAGRRVAVLDVPLSRLEPELNGIQVVEWGGHDAAVGFKTWPPGIADHIRSSVGVHPHPASCDEYRDTPGEFDRFVGDLEGAVRKRTEVTLDILGREDWDLFVQVFTESHCVGHQCWHIHDDGHPSHEPQTRAIVGDPVERVYRALDHAVGTIVEKAGDADVLLFSCHGMSHYRGAKTLLPDILMRLGVTTRRGRGRGGIGGRLVGVARRVWRELPEPLKESIRPVKETVTPGPSRSSEVTRIPADVSRSRCFSVPQSAPVSGIRLNLAEREPAGILRPGPEADAFSEALMADLREIVDDRTGRPLAAEVYRTDSVFEGPRLQELPDILVEWSDDPATGTTAHAGGRGATLRASSPKIGTVEHTNSYVRTGDHLRTGFFVFAGPRIRPDRREPISVMDFHPTICRMLGLPDPGVDGSVVQECVGART